MTDRDYEDAEELYWRSVHMSNLAVYLHDERDFYLVQLDNKNDWKHLQKLFEECYEEEILSCVGFKPGKYIISIDNAHCECKIYNTDEFVNSLRESLADLTDALKE